MKAQILLTLGLFTHIAISSQNNSVKIISTKTDSVINGTVYTIYGDAAVADVKETFKAVMESQDSMFVAIKREELSIIPGTSDYFCWYLCYGPVSAGTLPVWKAADTLWMYRDDTIGSFSVYLKPMMNLGQASYRYTFYPVNNPSDSSYLDILFKIETVGIDELEKSQISTRIDQSSNSLVVDMGSSNAINSKLDLYDSAGRLVHSSTIRGSKYTIGISDSWKSGIYVCRITEGSRIIHSASLMIHP